MTKLFLIQVKYGEDTGDKFPAETITRNLRFVTDNAIKQMTFGPVPAVEVTALKSLEDDDLPLWHKHGQLTVAKA